MTRAVAQINILMIQSNSQKSTTINDNHTRHFLHYASTYSISSLAKQPKDDRQFKNSHGLKSSKVFRRTPEEQFRRQNSEVSLLWPDKAATLQEEYEWRIKTSHDKKTDHKSSTGSKGSKGSTESTYGTIEHLKETTSTSAETAPCAPKRQTPSFLKTKSKALLNKRVPQCRLDRQGFKILKKLGAGRFGKVFLAVEVGTGFLVALKVVEKKKVISDGLLDQFIRELKIQTFLKHPNIIEVYGLFEDEHYFYTVMELGCDGQLYSIIQEKRFITEECTSFITKNLLQAVDYMHQLKILHRDIKPENIVRIMGNVKICDFGWAANKMTKQELRSTYCGTPLYLSPEILKGQRYDEKVDLWAIGILAYELLLGRSPFDIFEQEDLQKIMTEEVKFPEKKTSKEFQEFINHILNKNPKDRLSSAELLELRFIKKYEGFETCEQLCQ